MWQPGMRCIMATLHGKGQRHLHHQGNRVGTRVSQPRTSHANHTGCAIRVSNKGTESERGYFDKKNPQQWLTVDFSLSIKGSYL